MGGQTSGGVIDDSVQADSHRHAQIRLPTFALSAFRIQDEASPKEELKGGQRGVADEPEAGRSCRSATFVTPYRSAPPHETSGAKTGNVGSAATWPPHANHNPRGTGSSSRVFLNDESAQLDKETEWTIPWKNSVT